MARRNSSSSSLARLKVFEEKRNRFNKKDDKLEKLKACVDVLLEPEVVVEETSWDELLSETMSVVLGPKED